MTYEDLAALRLIANEATAMVREAEGEMAAAEGDHLRAEWHREEAKALRSPDRCRDAAHKAWVVHMADMHLRQGTVPPPGAMGSAEIEIVMDEIRDAAADADLLADRPSHEVAAPESI